MLICFLEKFVFFYCKTVRLSLTVSLARGILLADKVCRASRENAYINISFVTAGFQMNFVARGYWCETGK